MLQRKRTGAECSNASALVLLSFLLCFFWLAVPTHSQSSQLLPSLTNNYYTVVTAGFGSLGYSLHYEEYGNIANEFSLSVGRYYQPTAVEYTDELNNIYYLETPLGPYELTCTKYQLTTFERTRVMEGAPMFLVDLIETNVMFTNMGMTNAVRMQPTVRFTTTLFWSSISITPTATELDDFLHEAFAQGGVDQSTQYAVSATIDVYYSSDQYGNIVNAGNGAIPVRFSINGERSDGHGAQQINIVYDFSMWAQLDYYTSLYALSPPTWNCWQALNTSAVPPGVPVAASPLPAPNTTIPYWTGGRATMEIASSNNAPLQLDSLLKSAHGEELLIFISDPTNYDWYSLLYDYDFADQRDFQFAAGAVYTLNGTDANPYNQWDDNWQEYRFCTGTTINPASVSPIQWAYNAASISSIYANPNFFAGAKSLGRVQLTDKGIFTDAWSVVKTVAYNGAVYNFTLQLYVVANGWVNMGTFNAPQAAQIVRLAYSGWRYPARGSASSYSMQVDFYMQYIQAYDQYENIFAPSWYGCTEVVTGLPVLPPLPPQYTVSVSEAWYDSETSSQYTVYVDSTRGLRRLDGRFTPPNAFAMMSPSPVSKNYVTVVEWAQNVTITQGFSSLTMNNQAIPYTSYSSNQAPTCGSVTLSALDFNGVETLNFFDWLAQADPSQAMYVETKNVRGVDLDVYQVSATSENVGHFVVSTFQVYYLSVDETLINTVPVMAEVSVQFYNFYYFYSPSAQYQFYNFRANVPAGIFNAPSSLTCNQLPWLPAPVVTPEYYTDPDPTQDHTPLVAPTWPSVFSMLIEGQLLAWKGDNNIYVARWYVDFKNYRERIDIEPAFNISGVGGVNPVTVSYIFYYTPMKGGTFSFTNGTVVTYNGVTCVPASIQPNTINPLKQIPPGNLFDTFFPATTKALSKSSIYNINARWDYSRQDGVFNDEYDWNINTTYGGYKYAMSSSIYISIPEWINNAQTGIYNNTRIPLSIQGSGLVLSKKNQVVRTYSYVFRTAFYQAKQPGYAVFDASMLNCPTTPSSPWYNIYGTQLNVVSQSSSSVSTGTIVGAVVGTVGGLLVVAAVIFFVRYLRSGSPLLSKYGGGKKSTANGTSHDNELVGVGKVASDEAPENSLNRASLNNLVKEGNPLEVEVEVHDTTAPDAETTPAHTNGIAH